MKADVKLDVDDAVKAFREYNRRATTSIKKAIVKSAMQVERTAKQLFKTRLDDSIEGEPPRVQTGRLRASITHRLELEDEGPVGYVGTNVSYGPYMEFGTSRTKKHPFMNPALEMNKSDIEKWLAEAVRESENA